MRLPLALLLAAATACYGLRVLLLGDSVDRFTLFDWCEGHGANVSQKAFGDDKLLYHHGTLPWPPTICRWRVGENENEQNSSTSLAQIHFYGTNATGPYHSRNPGRVYPMQNTSERLPHALRMYLEETKGLFPQRIIWHSATWDAEYTALKLNEPLRHSAVLNRTLLFFEAQLDSRLDEIERFFNHSPDVEIGLRTAATSKTITCCSPSFNDVIRAVAKRRKMLLYDLDLDIWSSFVLEDAFIDNRHIERHASELQHTLDHSRYDGVLFRDWIHPVSSVTAAAAEKLMGRRWSGALFLPKKGEASKADLHFSTSSPHYAVLVRRESDASGALDFFRRQSGTWYRNVSLELVRALRLSGFDVVSLTLEQERHVLTELPGTSARKEDYGFAGIGGVFNGSDKANPWLCCTYAVTRDLYRTELSSEAAALGIARARRSKVFNVPLAWRELLLAIPQTRDLPQGYLKDGARLRLRGSRGEWLVANFSRHPAVGGGQSNAPHVEDVDQWAWSVIPPQPSSSSSSSSSFSS